MMANRILEALYSVHGTGMLTIQRRATNLNGMRLAVRIGTEGSVITNQEW